MTQRIRVLPMGPHEYSVDVTEGDTSTTHRVTVPQSLLDDLGPGLDEERLVTESFAFLLDKEPATSILPEFPLDTIASYFPDYVDEVRARLAG